jgi:hypothetical protein
MTDPHAYRTDEAAGDAWRLLLGDACERLGELATDSIDLSVCSPPFAQLYNYSPSVRDLSNSRDRGEFFEHYRFIIAEQLRVTRPGRVAAVHVADITQQKVLHGVIGLTDFSGEVVTAFVDAGWIFDGRVTVDKDPQAQAIRTKSLLDHDLAGQDLHRRRQSARPLLPLERRGRRGNPHRENHPRRGRGRRRRGRGRGAAQAAVPHAHRPELRRHPLRPAARRRRGWAELGPDPRRVAGQAVRVPLPHRRASGSHRPTDRELAAEVAAEVAECTRRCTNLQAAYIGEAAARAAAERRRRELESEVDQLETLLELAAVGAVTGGRDAAEVTYWRRRAEQDRANAVRLEARLAAAEGRRGWSSGTATDDGNWEDHAWTGRPTP